LGLGEGENRRARDPGEADPPVGDAGDAILGGLPCKTRDHDPNQENPCDPILSGDFRRPETEIRRWRSSGGTQELGPATRKPRKPERLENP